MMEDPPKAWLHDPSSVRTLEKLPFAAPHLREACTVKEEGPDQPDGGVFLKVLEQALTTTADKGKWYERTVDDPTLPFSPQRSYDKLHRHDFVCSECRENTGIRFSRYFVENKRFKETIRNNPTLTEEDKDRRLQRIDHRVKRMRSKMSKFAGRVDLGYLACGHTICSACLRARLWGTHRNNTFLDQTEECRESKNEPFLCVICDCQSPVVLPDLVSADRATAQVIVMKTVSSIAEDDGERRNCNLCPRGCGCWARPLCPLYHFSAEETGARKSGKELPPARSISPSRLRTATMSLDQKPMRLTPDSA